MNVSNMEGKKLHFYHLASPEADWGLNKLLLLGQIWPVACFFLFSLFIFSTRKLIMVFTFLKSCLKKKKKLTRRWHRPYVAWKAENIYYIWPFTEKFVDLNSYINQSRLLDWIHKYIIYKWFFFSTPILLFFDLFLSLASAVPFFLLFLSSVFLNFSVEV